MYFFREGIGLLCRRDFLGAFHIGRIRNPHSRTQLPRSHLASTAECAGSLIALVGCSHRDTVRHVMMYEVLISTTVALVLLPLNFWFAAELVLVVASLATFWELRHHVFGEPGVTAKH